MGCFYSKHCVAFPHFFVGWKPCMEQLYFTILYAILAIFIIRVVKMFYDAGTVAPNTELYFQDTSMFVQKIVSRCKTLKKWYVGKQLLCRGYFCKLGRHIQQKNVLWKELYIYIYSSTNQPKIKKTTPVFSIYIYIYTGKCHALSAIPIMDLAICFFFNLHNSSVVCIYCVIYSQLNSIHHYLWYDTKK